MHSWSNILFISAGKCTVEERIQPKVVIIGISPVAQVNISWQICNQSLLQDPVTTEVYYKNGSNYDSCNKNSKSLNINAGCDKVSSGTQDIFTCSLTKEFLGNLMPNEMDSICFLIRAHSGNWTEHRYIRCVTSFSEGSYCISKLITISVR